jgi:hypothetical protein
MTVAWQSSTDVLGRIFQEHGDDPALYETLVCLLSVTRGLPLRPVFLQNVHDKGVNASHRPGECVRPHAMRSPRWVHLGQAFAGEVAGRTRENSSEILVRPGDT